MRGRERGRRSGRGRGCLAFFSREGKERVGGGGEGSEDGIVIPSIVCPQAM